jgi:hypothetical protein
MSEHFLWKVRLKLRKWTTPIHILCGLIIAFAAYYCPPLAVILFVGIGGDEYWEWKRKGPGDDSPIDFWEVLAAIFAGAAILILLLSMRIMG